MTYLIKDNIKSLENIANSTDSLSINKQIKLVYHICQTSPGLFSLLELLIKRNQKNKHQPSYLDGIIFKALYTSDEPNIHKQINYHFKNGIVKLTSLKNINYLPLYKSLILNNFKEANSLTQIYLYELAGLNDTKQRQWLYFTDIVDLPSQDLKTIDNLWRIYSGGLFGFSIQRQIWLSSNQDWEKLWHQIGWKVNNINTRYPNEFIWNNQAPRGHLPLSNQLRGVQVLATLFKHPVWQTY